MQDTTELTPRARAKREQILTGAQRRFLQDGFGATSTDAVAAEAGVSKRTLYAYFPTKEALFAEVLGRLTTQQPPTAVSYLLRDEPPTTREELRHALLSLARLALARMLDPEYIALLRTIIADLPRFPHLAGLFRATVPEMAMRQIAALLAQAEARGIATVGDPDMAARLFVGALVTYTLSDGLFVTDGPPRTPAPQSIEQLIDLYMKVLA